AGGRRDSVPSRAATTSRALRARASPGQDALDGIRQVCRAKAAWAHAERAGHLQLPRLHACLREVEVGAVPAASTDGEGPDAREAEVDPRGPTAATPPACSCPR